MVTREPGATEVGVRIRSLLLDRQAATGPAGVVLAPRAEALLYAADRAHHVASVVRPALAKGSIVISDRYIDSSLAYQGAGRTLPVDEVSWLSAWATGGLQPDLVVLLDIDPAVGLGRVAGRGAADRLEAESRSVPRAGPVRVPRPRRQGPAPLPGGRRHRPPGARSRPQVAERVRACCPPASEDHDPADGLPGHSRSPLTTYRRRRRRPDVAAERAAAWTARIGGPGRPRHRPAPSPRSAGQCGPAAVTAPRDRRRRSSPAWSGRTRRWRRWSSAASRRPRRSCAASPYRPGAMTHAWLFTGPPGSGRSVAARAFAAALQCPTGRLRRLRRVPHHARRHPRRRAVGGPRGTVHRGRRDARPGAAGGRARRPAAAGRSCSSRTPTGSPRRPATRCSRRSRSRRRATVFLLCTPSTHPDDVSVTIRSRCRVVTLRTPSAEAIAGDAGRARRRRRPDAPPGPRPPRRATSAGPAGWPATREARARREAVLAVPRRLTGIGACFDAAAALIAATEAEAAANVSEVDAKETAELEIALGAGGTGRGAAGAFRGSAGALKDLERRQKSRATRAKRDALDRALVDLAGFYRDVLSRRLGAAGRRRCTSTPPADAAAAAADAGPPESTLRRLEAVLACRDGDRGQRQAADRRRGDDGHPLARLTAVRSQHEPGLSDRPCMIRACRRAVGQVAVPGCRSQGSDECGSVRSAGAPRREVYRWTRRGSRKRSSAISACERLLAEFDKALAKVEVTVRSPDGLVEVVVGADGAIRDVVISEPAHGRSPRDLSRAVQAAVTAAADAAQWARTQAAPGHVRRLHGSRIAYAADLAPGR